MLGIGGGSMSVNETGMEPAPMELTVNGKDVELEWTKANGNNSHLEVELWGLI